MRRLSALTTLILTGILCAIAPPARSAEPDVRALEDSGGGTSFEAFFGVPEWREEATEQGPLSYPVWEGIPLSGEPGEPLLPERIIRVAVPRGGPVTFDVITDRRAAAQGVRFPRAPIPAPPPSDRGPFRPGDGITAAAETPAPRPIARIVADGIERGIRIVNVAVSPVAWDPAGGRAEWASRVEVRLRVADARPAPAIPGRVRADGPEERRLRRTLVNPGEAMRLLTAAEDGPDRSELGVPERWFDDAGGWVKIRIRANGVYALTRADLAGIGVPVDSVDPRSFRLYSGPLIAQTGYDSTAVPSGYVITPYWRSVREKNGLVEGFDEGPTAYNARDGYAGFEEVAIWVPGEDDGLFDASDRVVFYALGPDNFPDRFGAGGNEFLVNRYTSETVYWLGWATTLPGPPLRMAELDASPGAGERITAGPARFHAEGNTWYDPSMYLAGYRWEEWFWERMDNQRPAGTTKRVSLPGRVPGTPFDARVRFWGANQPIGEGDLGRHHVRMEVNGTLVAEPVWSSYEPREVTLAGETRFGDATDLDFTFIIPDLAHPVPNADRYDLVHLCWIDVTWRRSFLASPALPREFQVDPGEGSTARIAAGAAPWLFDVTDFRRPVRLSGVVPAGVEGQYDFVFPSGGVRTIVATRDAALARPASIERDAAPARWLREIDDPADYVIVCWDDFTEEADILAAWRRDHLDGISEDRPARVRVVRVSDVYDEFSWGMVDPAAIRYFLEYAFRYWHDSPGDRLSFALFLGDHTYDMRDVLGTGERSLVPSWEDNRDPLGNLRDGNVQYVADEPLARFDGLYDAYTDLYIGRITAVTKQEARDVIVGKVIRAEQNPDRGPWRNKAILVADDVCQGRKADGIRFGHMEQTEQVDAAIPGVFDRDKIYLFEYGETCDVDAKPAAKRALLESWNEGAWLVNYIGHGADIVLADEHVLDQVDIPLLGNEGRLPVVSTFSCSVGKFSKPLSRGLGEGLVMASRGGALACVAATHLTYSGSNASLNVIFMQKLFGRGVADPLPVGVALMEAKRQQGGQSNKYVCLGDPASRISVPDLPAEAAGVSALDAGTLASLDVRVDTGGSGTGSVDVRAEGAREVRVAHFFDRGYEYTTVYRRTGATLFRGSSPLVADSAAVAFVVPIVLRPGNDGRVRTYVEGSGWDALGGATGLPVVGATSPPSDTTGPALDLALPSPTIVPGQAVALSAEDPAGINLTRQFEFQGILVRIRDTSGLELARIDVTDRFEYAAGSHTRGDAHFTVPDLDPNAYDLVITAYDNFGNRGESVRRVDLTPAGSDLSFRQVAAWPNPIAESTRILFTLDRPAEVTARIFSVSGRLVREIRLDAAAGPSTIPWDVRDGVGDPVANGVYLLRLSASETGGRGIGTHLERLVVYR